MRAQQRIGRGSALEMGGNAGTAGDQEIFTLDEMIRLFELSEINNSASAFNTGKLQWLNQ